MHCVHFRKPWQHLAVQVVPYNSKMHLCKGMQEGHVFKSEVLY